MYLFIYLLKHITELNQEIPDLHTSHHMTYEEIKNMNVLIL